jgi:protein TonB
VRVAAAFVGAFVITTSLYVLMDRMISRDRVRLVNTYNAQPIEFVRTPLDSETRSKDRRRKPPPKPKEIKRVSSDLETSVVRAASLPQEMMAYDVKSLLGEGGGVALGQTLVEGNAESMAMVMASDLTALSMLPPQYPPSALMRGLEGWVQLAFKVTEEGLVDEPTVVDAKPRGVFDSAARNAVLRWRFRPVVSGGQAVAVRAFVQIDFNLPDK